jgi:CBS domain-containing protein
METLADYVRRGGQHFVPLDALPVVEPEINLSDALGIMKQRRTAGVLVHEGEQSYRLLLHEHLSGLNLFGRRVDPTSISVTAIVGVAPVLPIVEASRRRDDVWAAMTGERPFRSVVVVAGSEVLGLHTEAEDWQRAFYTTPTVYRCAMGHNWPPPPPASCPVDGTSIGPS